MSARAALLFEASILLGEPVVIGRVNGGFRRIIPIVGGGFEGPDLHGRVLPFGADWNFLHDSGRMDLDSRYTLETDRGELIYVSNVGHRYHPPNHVPAVIAGEPVDMSAVRSTGAARMESGSPRLAHLNERTYLPRGRREAGRVVIAFYGLD